MSQYMDDYEAMDSDNELLELRITQLQEQLEELRKENEELREICAESYQVVGVLADDCGRFNDDEGGITRVDHTLGDTEGAIQAIVDEMLREICLKVAREVEKRYLGYTRPATIETLVDEVLKGEK